MRAFHSSFGRHALLSALPLLFCTLMAGCARAEGQTTTVRSLLSAEGSGVEGAEGSGVGDSGTAGDVSAGVEGPGTEGSGAHSEIDPDATVEVPATAEPPSAQDPAVEAPTPEAPAIDERSQLELGVAALEAGDAERALALLRPLAGRTMTVGEARVLLTAIIDACAAVGDKACAMPAFDALLGNPALLTASERVSVDAALGALVADASNEEVSALYASVPRTGRAFSVVGARALRLAFAAGDMERTSTIAGELRGSGVMLEGDLGAMAERAAQVTRVDPRVVGAILPLSGRGREVGQRALQGLQLAAGSMDGGASTQLIVRDGGASPEQAARAVDELAALGVVAIIGPLDASAAAAAAARAEALAVPLLSLSPASDAIGGQRAMVFQLLTSPAVEVEALVRQAFAEGKRRFASFGPDNGYGRAMQAALTQAVTALGGQVVGHTTYPAGATSLSREAQALARLRPDAILVPDRASQVALVAPALASAGLTGQPTGARVLVPSVGADAAQLRPSSRYLEGALFSVIYDRGAAMGAEAAFRGAYEARYGTIADVYAAYAYDALQLVRTAVARGASDRGGLARGLLGTRGQATVGASRGLGVDRRPAAPTRLMQWRAGALAPL